MVLRETMDKADCRRKPKNLKPSLKKLYTLPLTPKPFVLKRMKELPIY